MCDKYLDWQLLKPLSSERPMSSSTFENTGHQRTISFTMNPQTQFGTENAFSRFLELIREIVESSGNGNCIYRGEPEHYDKVASAPYRPSSPSEFDSGDSDLERFKNEALKNVRDDIQDNEKDDFEHLAVTQHYGGLTDLIDFTTDYKIALFFACNGFHDKDGRVIVLPRTEDIDRKYRVKQPLNDTQSRQGTKEYIHSAS